MDDHGMNHRMDEPKRHNLDPTDEAIAGVMFALVLAILAFFVGVSIASV